MRSEKSSVYDGEYCIIVYEFKIEGMTCVACSSAIEKGLTSEFKSKGLVPKEASEENTGVSVVLLMHKMRIAFHKELALKHKIDANSVISEVEDLGFGAELINTFEE